MHMPRRVIAFPRDEDVPASPVLTHRCKMLPHEVTVDVAIEECACPLGGGPAFETIGSERLCVGRQAGLRGLDHLVPNFADRLDDIAQSAHDRPWLT